MFRVLPYQGGDPRQISEVVNNLMNGKSNNTGTVTLNTGNATTTSLVDERISVDTKIVLIPFSDAAELDSAPYGAFQDTTDQVATTTTNEYIISYDTTDYSNGVSVESTNKVRVKSYGIYNIAFSIQFANADVSIQDVDVWFKKGSGGGAASNVAGKQSVAGDRTWRTNVRGRADAFMVKAREKKKSYMVTLLNFRLTNYIKQKGFETNGL